MLPSNYQNFYETICQKIDSERVFIDPLHTLAYGTDASLYRLTPKIVIKALSEQELADILFLANKLSLPITVRTAGTSLSGQSSTDSILVALNWGFKKYQISPDASTINLEPGVIGEFANHILKPFNKKIGPDPASLSSAMIGGIINNNSSGMCCGVEENSYQTIASLKIMLYDGTILDTSIPESISNFRKSHQTLLKELKSLAEKVKKDRPLKNKIIEKYKIKNTTGYSLNALVDFKNPIDILTHLIVGSEGTLAVLLNVTLRTVHEHPLKASAMIYYSDIYTACTAVELLKNEMRDIVFAVELFDRTSIKTIEDNPIAPTFMKTMGEKSCSLLVETRSFDKKKLNKQIQTINKKLSTITTLEPIEFSSDPKVYSKYWTLRKGLIPSIGAIRKLGTTVIIEDVAFPINHLADATVDLQNLFKKYHYDEGIIMGHALDGNLHLVFAQEFSNETEIKRYDDFMQELCKLTANKHGGSLKAEHGTGRNVAPFVEMEWGSKAYKMMKKIKAIFDPDNLLNPGVLINADPTLHIKNLKFISKTHPLVDKCIECGFCESECPSRTHSLTPRQRIVISREISRLKGSPEKPASIEDQKTLKEIERLYAYEGIESCAGCSMCAPACPVKIDTGKLMKELQSSSVKPWQKSVADGVANNFSTVLKLMGAGLDIKEFIEDKFGVSIPTKVKNFPKRVNFQTITTPVSEKQVVYFPSCISRTLSASHEAKPLPNLIPELLERAGYHVIYPNAKSSIEKLCCGMPFSSKGFNESANQKFEETKNALWEASNEGSYPILIDTSPCAATMIDKLNNETPMNIFEPIGFIKKFLLNNLPIKKLKKIITIHTTCSSSKLGLQEDFLEVANSLAKEVVVPQEIKCCGFAGDKGFKYPKLNEAALSTLGDQVSGCSSGYSNSVTCEIGLTDHGGIPYSSIFYLLDEAIKKSKELEKTTS